VLAADLNAPAARPAAATALCDGWAVASDDTLDAGGYAPAVLSLPPRRVDAGAPLPAGYDAVAPLDVIVLRGGAAEALASVAPGEGVLAAGADVQAGLPLRLAGERLRIIDSALLAAAGLQRAAVRAPRIRLVRACSGEPSIGGGYGWLANALAAAGASVVTDAEGDVPPDQMEAAFHHEASDAILVVGGTGCGTPDTSVLALKQSGRVAFHGVGLLPGETAAFGTVAARSVLLLPSRIDAMLAAWLALGRPWLMRLAGARDDDRIGMAQLLRKVTSPLGIAEIVPVRRQGSDAEPLASGYLSLAALARADGWLLVPPESEGYPAGAQVPVRPLQ
jgi:molybdopterin biosynthesis enzyme